MRHLKPNFLGGIPSCRELLARKVDVSVGDPSLGHVLDFE